MDKVIAEIIIGVVILSLLITVVPLYRNSADLVVSVGEKLDNNENIKEVTIGKPPRTDDIVSGKYLVNYIEYLSARKTSFFITMILPGTTYCLFNETYQMVYDIVQSDTFYKVLSIDKSQESVYKIDFIYIDSEAAENVS